MEASVVKNQLKNLKSDLERRLAAIDRDLSARLDADSEERALQVENDEVLVAMREEAGTQIAATDAALERLSSGTYGDCVKCHMQIGEDRLAALPYTPFCAECAQSCD
ncbi:MULTISPECIES: TraR/DksA family transcriptional regulator [unclassified Rhizobium]|uniref:TraR/DksA family transcriptional regulator n=1 Tax=unclassified Rhizobium TaxID=2613769 RepID=UPI001ADA46F5|nr:MULTISPECIES: TraR/DksA C4-type zinc finger protein [unclassified Rhizobium]MBO9127873.1 TraR/DksA family transcriptional regulator [Rhizobium sp. 16-488-2b]MBO9175161.1 TraR/DksA family transcriptional regulator [Rhizobium sp. 16-488-2a]